MSGNLHSHLWRELIAPHLEWVDLLAYGSTCHDARGWVREGTHFVYEPPVLSFRLCGADAGWVWQIEDVEGLVARVPASLPARSRTVVKLALMVWPDIELECRHEMYEYLSYRYDVHTGIVESLRDVILSRAELFCDLERQAERWSRRNGIRKLGFTWRPRGMASL